MQSVLDLCGITNQMSDEQIVDAIIQVEDEQVPILMDEIEEQVYQDIDAIFAKEAPSVQDMEHLLNYVQTHQALFRCLFQQCSGISISRFSTILHTHYSKKLPYSNTLTPSLESVYLYEFLYTGILGVLQK